MIDRPLLLLLGTGALLGLNFPLGRMAMAADIGPALWAAVISLGAGSAVGVATMLAERGRPAGKAVLGFAMVSGLISYVVPNLLTYAVIPRIGSGLTAIMFALSPVVTAFLSTILRVRPPTLLGLVGIALGLAGAVVIITARNSGSSAGGGLFWLLAALLIPLFLGVGNVYRTMAWPQGASPMRLAAASNLAAVPPLLLITVWLTPGVDLEPLAAAPGLIAAQIAVSTAMFLMFFRLQQIGGPTYLSQIGYVAAAVGLVIGVSVFGESYPGRVWAGAGLIAAGIALSTVAQFRKT
jgi:drug/metabolite transporter (DMT)-like permease